MRKVRVALWGFGAMGQGIARTLHNRQGVEVVGLCDSRPDYQGRSLHELLGLPQGQAVRVQVSPRIEEALKDTPIDCCVIATDSYVQEVFPKVEAVVTRGINALTIAEEMSFPAAQHPQLAERMDQLARKHGVSILGTGINPGLMMDLLAVCLSGAMTEVTHVRCERVNSLSPFGATVMREQGIGITPEQFEAGVREGSLAGHVGFAESAAMIAHALGLPYDQFSQRMEPIITQVDRKSPHGFAASGQVAGVRMTASAVREGEERISLIHPQQIEPQLAGVDTGDYISLTGTPPVHMAVKPEVDGGLGTIAMACNLLPFLVAARPGLLTMLDLPVPRCVMGDYRQIAFGEAYNG
ncbi:MAG: Gfo/Idh/MocA family oxidoreductase [Clostridiales bacterium]|nr:Gfo/Idh/MocA family oxidoreductase [Clostridiales bacterium]